MRRIIITLATALLVVTSVAIPAFAEEPGGAGHVALGDSISAGSVANNPDRTSYVPRLNRWLRSNDCTGDVPEACPHLTLSNYSVGGATSDTLIVEQLPYAVAEILARRSDSDPFNDVGYITLSIGGNDVFRPVMEACAGGLTPECSATVQAVFGNYQANLVQILGTLRAVAPDAEIAIMTYDNSLANCDMSDLAPLADLVLEGGGPLPGGLNDIIRGVAGATGVTVVEVYGLLDPRDFVGGDDCLHPDDSGHRKIARAFLGAMT
jgi:lysophospholipase L1-like esterase